MDYRDKNMLKGSHPLTMSGYSVLLLILALALDHPFFLIAVLATGLATAAASGENGRIAAFLKYGVVFAVLVAVINVALGRQGQTILLLLPIMGLELKLTMEALAFALVMSLRVISVIAAFLVFYLVVDADRMLRVLGRRGGPLVTMAAIGMRLAPMIASDFSRVRDMQGLRAGSAPGGKAGLEAFAPTATALLAASLGRSSALAAALQLKGFASGRVSSRGGEIWRPRDFAILGAMAGGILLTLISARSGLCSFSFYPALGSLSYASLAAALALALVLAFPALLAWGWSKWPWLKSKI